jgi:hypothetical protein
MARTEKRIAAERSNPLLNTGILQHILQYSLDSWFVSSVSKLWQRTYCNFDFVEVPEVVRGPWSATAHCKPDMTLRRSIFTSPSRLSLALELGALCLSDEATAYTLGVLSSTETLAAALELGLELSDDLAKGIAVSGRSSSMVWLCEELQYELPNSIADWAVLSRSTSMLDLVSQHGAYFYETAMQTAAAAGSLEVCKYLRSEGCRWCGLSLKAAAEHTDVLCWLREQGCSEDIFTYSPFNM